MDKRAMLHQFHEFSRNFLQTGESRDNIKEIGYRDRKEIDLNKKLLSSMRRLPAETAIFDIDTFLANIYRRVKINVPENKKLHWNLETSGATLAGNESSLESLLENVFINAFEEIPDGEMLIAEGKLIDSTFHENQDEKRSLPGGNYYRLYISSSYPLKSKNGASREISSFLASQNNYTEIGIDTFFTVLKQFSIFFKLEEDNEKGSRFVLYIPVTLPYGEGGDFLSNISDLSYEKKIMVIDDELMICEMIADMLSGKPYEIVIFQNGFEAVKYYRQHKEQVAIIILDMIMPEISGKETFQLLREVNPDVKVLISSGYSKKDDARDIVQDGALEYLQKPYSFHNLQDAISRHL